MPDGKKSQKLPYGKIPASPPGKESPLYQKILENSTASGMMQPTEFLNGVRLSREEKRMLFQILGDKPASVYSTIKKSAKDQKSARRLLESLADKRLIAFVGSDHRLWLTRPGVGVVMLHDAKLEDVKKGPAEVVGQLDFQLLEQLSSLFSLASQTDLSRLAPDIANLMPKMEIKPSGGIPTKDMKTEIRGLAETLTKHLPNKEDDCQKVTVTVLQGDVLKEISRTSLLKTAYEITKALHKDYNSILRAVKKLEFGGLIVGLDPKKVPKDLLGEQVNPDQPVWWLTYHGVWQAVCLVDDVENTVMNITGTASALYKIPLEDPKLNFLREICEASKFLGKESSLYYAFRNDKKYKGLLKAFGRIDTFEEVMQAVAGPIAPIAKSMGLEPVTESADDGSKS